MAHILLRHRDIPDINKLEVYRKNGGFEAFKQVVTSMKPEAVTEVVKASGLRGRGGAGFPTGLKWAFMDNKNWPHYVVANADESEPGTFKDREIMENNPFQFLEGVAISAYAVGAHAAYVYLRGEFWQVAAFLDERIEDMEKAGLLGGKLFGTDYELKIYTHLGAGAYICGEETALLESMEGKRGQPRLRPPFPPSFGLYGKPTVVNNVETFTNIPMIFSKGADWYKALGTADSAGVKVFSLSGRVKKPGNYELPFGTTFRQLVYEHGGGIINDRPVKAIMAAGASSSIIKVDDKALDTPMDYASVRTLGADLGSASVIVIDDTVSIEWVISKTVEFFKHESCGKCTPCREGNYWMMHVIERMEAGEDVEANTELLLSVAKQMQNKCLCALGEFATMAVVSGIERFPDDFTTSSIGGGHA
ncbi:MAG: NADH-quinone oxidoreductase subunit F [Chloroflexi bacterium GWB2_49_20]|nr:MAG: NADH-quinone oxidoreductase subunit F [Chloroflexi bacterium GWB2_49_20]OGN79229.1 MAG: NADH-quinone oxidoreductase subunit F [Chloroflexi bacterium GWC2_49_37]OGN83001.1 MAG: NADH-quinone oxidoreductase subunit F [Chloroflexi bacterium GWD2_49_16]HCC78660.1 NADH-quinone oxidoreductase subunit NuoF [Anaerolineae bacterium]